MSIELNRAAFEAFAQSNEFGAYRIDRKGDGYDSSHTQLMWMSWCAAIQQAEAQQPATGEPFGYIHHFAAHDERGALIDTTWEADGCADPLPHPTFPAMWKWSHCTPFYTTPQPAQATQAEAKQPATGEPVGFTYQAEIEYADSTGGNGAFWRVPPDLDDEAVPLYTHPAPSVRAGVVRVPLQVLKDASEALGNFVSDHGWGDTDMQAMDNLDAYIARHDAKAKKGQP